MATLSQNITQAISDFDSIKDAIEDKGVTVPANTPTSQYASLIENIAGDAENVLISLINRSATQLTVPTSVTQIGDYAFYHNNSLTSVVLSANVTKIGNYAFAYSSSLASINLPSSLLRIEERAFDQCTSLSNIVLPSGMTVIRPYAFNKCTSLASINIPASVTSIEASSFYDAGLTSLSFSARTENLRIESNAFEKGRFTSVSLPEKTKFIGIGAFRDCTNLSTLYLPNTITYLGSNVFQGCTRLENVTLGNNFFVDQLDLSASTLYTEATIVSWLNALESRPSGNMYTLRIGSANLAKLTAEEIAIATDKRWNLA